MPYRDFLETYPLYRKYNKKFDFYYLKQVPKPPIKMYCPECKSEQTFIMTNEWHEGTHENKEAGGVVAKSIYGCVSCSKFIRYFMVLFSSNNNYVMKVGQEPAWDISMDKDLAIILNSHIDIYKKGLICESQSYGIGAYAYYRRITELIIDELLGDVGDMLSGEEHNAYIIALQKTKDTRVTQDKINIVKDLLPEILRPDGQNPLSVLHGVLSEGLHGMSDEECMDNAISIRNTLVYLVRQVTATKNTSKTFSDSMKSLLQKKTDRAT